MKQLGRLTHGKRTAEKIMSVLELNHTRTNRHALPTPVGSPFDKTKGCWGFTASSHFISGSSALNCISEHPAVSRFTRTNGLRQHLPLLRKRVGPLCKGVMPPYNL